MPAAPASAAGVRTASGGGPGKRSQFVARVAAELVRSAQQQHVAPRGPARAAAGPRPARRRRCCPCRRRPRSARGSPGTRDARPARSGPLHQFDPGIPRSPIAHSSSARCSRGVRQRLEPVGKLAIARSLMTPAVSRRYTATAAASRVVWVSDTSTCDAQLGRSRAPPRRAVATSAVHPCPAPRRRGSSRPRSPSALATASLAQNRAARCCPGRRPRRRICTLPVGEQPLGEPRGPLQRALEPLDLQQVDPDLKTVPAHPGLTRP